MRSWEWPRRNRARRGVERHNQEADSVPSTPLLGVLLRRPDLRREKIPRGTSLLRCGLHLFEYQLAGNTVSPGGAGPK